MHILFQGYFSDLEQAVLVDSKSWNKAGDHVVPIHLSRCVFQLSYRRPSLLCIHFWANLGPVNEGRSYHYHHCLGLEGQARIRGDEGQGRCLHSFRGPQPQVIQ
jgi:hypothetical protein